MESHYLELSRELQRVINTHLKKMTLVDWHMLSIIISSSCIWNSSVALVRKNEPLPSILGISKEVRRKILQTLEGVDKDISSLYSEMWKSKELH